MTFKEALQAAYILIKDHREEFICCAISAVVNQNHCNDYLAEKYRERVQKQLGECHTYNEWMDKHHPEYLKDCMYGFREHMNKAREGRLNWINHMIGQL